jgi:hypothetical protein
MTENPHTLPLSHSLPLRPERFDRKFAEAFLLGFCRKKASARWWRETLASEPPLTQYKVFTVIACNRDS